MHSSSAPIQRILYSEPILHLRHIFQITQAKYFSFLLRWEVKFKFLPTSFRSRLLPFAECYIYIRFEVFTAVTMKNAVFWDVAPCRSCVNRHLLTLVPRSRIFLPWKWRWYVLPKLRSHKIYTAPHPRRRYSVVCIVSFFRAFFPLSFVFYTFMFSPLIPCSARLLSFNGSLFRSKC
jgi:hypothetical protein